MAETEIVSDGNNKRDDVSIQIEDAGDMLASSIGNKLESIAPLASERCIYRIPQLLRRVNEATYTPRVISIGPYHRGKESLQAMEEHKWRYLRIFLNHFPNKKSIQDYIKALRELHERARQCYIETIQLSVDEFVEMMLLDSCFIIVFLLRVTSDDLKDSNNDPIFHTMWMSQVIQLDMVLLENQLPFFVLERLLQLAGPDSKGHETDIRGLMKSTFMNVFMENHTIDPDIVPKHFLDFLLHFFMSSSLNNLPQDNAGCIVTHSATELHQAGVKFVVGRSSLLMDVRFSKSNGILEIPTLNIDDRTEILFRNLIAWEQCQDLPIPYIISYAFLMDCLINTPEDVSLLIKYGVIKNWLGDNKETSLLFNKLCKDVCMGRSNMYFSSLCKDLNAYRKISCHEWQATLRRDYCNTPWRIISFIAAVILLILSLLQTIFTIHH
ncbi:hypothetical protein HHK36_025750 [Tetracentron sinense]|uniref:Uncharacterized protein n=1 Tax=Tetracentron sinense TaxID=13715 RepID=A0A834YJC2_TETSI|nr:hypothetical protein HHK36_025750 [Tetracentron sinense]